MNFFGPLLWVIAFRSLLQHRLRTLILGAAIAGVTALLVTLTGAFVGIRTTLLLSATTLMSGHVNVAGFYKASASAGAPVVTNYKKIRTIIDREVPELDYVVQRGRGWAKLVSESSSQQAGIGGIDITNEPGFRQVIQVKEGSLDGLTKPNAILIFEGQAKKLGVKVGDTMAAHLATRAQGHVDLGHARHERLGRLNGLRVGRRHLQGQLCCWQLDPFASGCQHPIVANAFRSGGQDVQQESAHKLCSRQSLQAFGPFVIGTHRKRHLALADCANALIADGRAVRVAAQVLQHLGGATQRGLGVHHPVVLV